MACTNTQNWNGPDVALSVISSWKSKRAVDQHLSVRSKDFKYIRYYNGAEELYDHTKDPHEWNNLAKNSNYLELKKRLKGQMFQFLKK